MEGKKGQLKTNTNANSFNQLSFIIKQSIFGLVDTCFVGQVQMVNEDMTVDVLPLINIVDGNGESVPQSVVFNLPYLRYQGGECKVDIKPAVGDIGIVCLTKDDSSSGVKNKTSSVPTSFKKFSKSNGFYVMSVASTCAEPKHSLTITGDGIKIESTAKVEVMAPEMSASTDNLSVDAKTCTVNGESVSVQASNSVSVTGSGSVSVTGGTVLLSGSVDLGGSGGQPVARVGDEVLVGDVKGVITAGSATVKAV